MKKLKNKGEFFKVNKLNKETGITLIALVITIIVLLILAGVSMATLTGQDGILTKATIAKENTEDGEEKEKIGLAVTTAMADETNGYGVLTDGKLRQEIENQFGSDSSLSGTGPWTYTGKRKTYTIQTSGKVEESGETPEVKEGTLVWMYEQAQADGCTNSDGTCTNANHLHAGDYVDYVTPTTGEYKSTAEKNGYTDQIFNVSNNGITINWRVLGIDDSGEHILLTSGSSVEVNGEDGHYYLKGARGYINAEDELNKISKIYKNDYAESARSINIDDINKACGVTVSSSGLTPNVNQYDWEFGQTYSYTDQYASPEDYLNNKKSSFSKTSNRYNYKGNNEALKTATNTKLYNMIFGTTGKGYYWLASHAVLASSDYAYFFVGCVNDGGAFLRDILFYSGGYENYRNYGVRPVISLKSNITTEQINRLEADPIEDWLEGCCN